jgi:DNA-binding transcriptional ArsR family regulator
MARRPMTAALLERIAERFKALAEPNRLQLLHAMRNREATVGDLVQRSGLTQANVSKHLQLLLTQGFVLRRKEGLFTYYRLADQDVFRLCDLMCGRLDRDLRARQKALGD